MQIDADTQREFLRRMMAIRIFESEMAARFSQGELPGFMHVYLGEEATGVGVCGALRKDDTITSTHRGHGHCIAKGGELRKVAAELMGKEAGYSHGRGGSMHIFSKELGILGSNGIVGGGLPLATGAGLAAKLQKSDRVSVCFFGDGAANEGVFHESLNMAGVHRLPVIYVCENNLYATETPVRDATRTKDFADRAAIYGMPGVIADGNDVLDVHAKASEAVARARRGEGPTLLESKTYRVCGHYVGHAETGYRTKEELEQWQRRDPIQLFSKRLIDARIMTAEQIDRMREQVKKEFDDAYAWAKAAPSPKPESALDFVWA
ncbi:MAG: thiamine pyrophosphate-dependent dehydrogenase E1 component subunit alpha [Phycisphaerae bacterium]|nr:thiamine pyrophosphate-dependent dehydrogenase E1 component subunit alpha [Phycisphaerae bacterium]